MSQSRKLTFMFLILDLHFLAENSQRGSGPWGWPVPWVGNCFPVGALVVDTVLIALRGSHPAYIFIVMTGCVFPFSKGTQQFGGRG